jgi:SAM-dependent methyltransferase
MNFACPACACQTVHRYLFSKNSCRIFKCAECGLGRAECGEFDVRAYYTGDYFSGGRRDGYADYLGSEPVLRREFARTVQFIRGYRNSGRLLEIGCAYGFFLEEARLFYDVVGIELAQSAAEFCRSRGLAVSNGVADEATLAPLGTFDVIILLDVIEHLPDPLSTLALCRRYLNPGGFIVLTTGDFSSRHARFAGRFWRLMTPPQHLWYFTPASMERFARSLDLTLNNCDHPWKLVPLALVQFQLRRLLGRTAALPTGATSGIGLPINLLDAMRCVFGKQGREARARFEHRGTFQ